jgi:hypothetical protein
MPPQQVASLGPQTTIDPKVEGRLATAGRMFRWTAAIYSLITVIRMAGGWGDIFRQEELPSIPEVTPLTAGLLAVLAMGALLAGGVRSVPSSSVVWRRFGIALCLLSATLGGVFVFFYIANLPMTPWGGLENVPAFSAALSALVLGASVAMLSGRFESQAVSAQVGCFLIFSLAAVIVLGYAYGDSSLGRIFTDPKIPFQAALLILILSVGILLLRPGSGLLSAASSPGAGGKLLRRVGPVVLLAPALLLFLARALPSWDQVDALAVIAVGLGLILLILLAVGVRVLDDLALDAITSAAEKERAQIGLEQEAPLVARLAEVLHTVRIGSQDQWDVATRFRQATGAVAGDASGVRAFPDGTLGVVMVDVTGHGVQPAVRAIRLRDLALHSLSLGRSPGEALGDIAWIRPGDELASAVVLKVDARSGRATLAAAGHPPVVYTTSQESRLVGPTGPLLFLNPDVTYGQETWDFGVGDSVVLFSDGIADIQREEKGRTEPQQIGDLLIAEGGDAARSANLVMGFGEPEPSDDQSVVVIRRAR